MTALITALVVLVVGGAAAVALQNACRENPGGCLCVVALIGLVAAAVAL